jgi:hypothetical protein
MLVDDATSSALDALAGMLEPPPRGGARAVAAPHSDANGWNLRVLQVRSAGADAAVCGATRCTCGPREIHRRFQAKWK